MQYVEIVAMHTLPSSDGPYQCLLVIIVSYNNPTLSRRSGGAPACSQRKAFPLPWRIRCVLL